jgi:predicted kinase
MVLIIFGGLPGVGKTSIARELARQIGAVYLRIDSIEQALRIYPLEDQGYRVAYAVAEDNLRIGRTVIADSVNPIAITRDAWLDVATRTQAGAMEIEIVCSDAGEHRRRVETRIGPAWAEVVAREYHSWDRRTLIIDTSAQTVEQCVNLIRAHLLK